MLRHSPGCDGHMKHMAIWAPQTEPAWLHGQPTFPLTADFWHSRPERAVAVEDSSPQPYQCRESWASRCHPHKQAAGSDKITAYQKGGFLGLFCSPRVLDLIWDHGDQSCRSCLLHCIPLTTFSLFFYLESHLAIKDRENNSIYASFIKVRSLPVEETPHTTFHNEGKNPKYQSVSLTSFAHETSCLLGMIKFI